MWSYIRAVGLICLFTLIHGVASLGAWARADSIGSPSPQALALFNALALPALLLPSNFLNEFFMTLMFLNSVLWGVGISLGVGYLLRRVQKGRVAAS